MGSEESKAVDSTGEVNNNVVITEAKSGSNQGVVLLLIGIFVIKVVEMIYLLYKLWHHKMKKKYSGGNNASGKA